MNVRQRRVVLPRPIEIVSIVALLGVSLAGQQATSPSQLPTPTFKSDVNAVLVDVRILDGDGQFVSDLTKNDLEVFEDGQRQAVTTFDLVNVPIHPDDRPTFAGKTVDADVSSNEHVEGRLYVILMDDLHTNPLRTVTAQALAREFIEHHLTEADRAVVLTTSGRRDVTQEFTNNRKRLFDLVAQFQGGFQSASRCEVVAQVVPAAQAVTSDGKKALAALVTADAGSCDVADDRSSLEALSRLAKWLSAVNGRRKAIVFISEGFDGHFSNAFDSAESDVDAYLDDLSGGSVTKSKESDAAAAISGELRAVLEAAARANVSIDAFDPNGLPGGPQSGIAPVPGLADDTPYDDKHLQSRLMLQALAKGTGGFALTRSNDFAKAMTQVVTENSSYYLLGYLPTNGRQDGKFRKLEVRTSRAGLKVQSRTGYTARNESAMVSASPAAVPPELTDLMATPVQISGLTMNIAAPSFIGKGAKASVEVIAEVPAHDLLLLSDAASSNLSLDLLIAVADVDGHVKATEHGALDMKLSAASRDAVTAYGLRVLSRLDVAPGRYLLRIAGVDGIGHTRGSVQYDLDVPDFSKAPLTMSGLAIASLAEGRRPTTGSDKDWRQHFTEAPTAARVFAIGDELHVSGEIYSNEKPSVQVAMTSTVQDEAGTIVFRHEETLPSGGSGKPVSYRHDTTIPLAQMLAGNYLLTVDARNPANAKAVATRQLPFTVK